MRLCDFLNMEEDRRVSGDDAAVLNRDLATKTVADIEPNDRQKVLDYLLLAMALNSVDRDIWGKIDALLTDLQADSFA